MDCKNLRRIHISSFNTERAFNMNYMFNGCPKLEFLNITTFEFNMQESYYNIFDDDENLHLIITADFYYHIIDANEYLIVIDENVTIV